LVVVFFFFQAEDGIRDFHVTGVQTCALPIYFDIPDDERVWVSIEDAELQMKSSKDASTDIIFADMYDAYHMSPMQGQKQFVQECWRTLSKSGWLVINYHRLPDPNSPFFDCLIAYFSTIMVCSGAYANHILVACKS